MPACLLALCGLVGAGKTTIANAVFECSSPSLRLAAKDYALDVIHVDYDTIYKELAQGRPFSPELWNETRHLALARIRTILNSSRCLDPLTVVVADDNNYYASMRHALFRIATDESASYAQIYVECDASIASERNAARSAPVSSDAAIAIAARFEPPSNRWWEANTLVVNTQSQGQGTSAPGDIMSQLHAILDQALTTPLRPPEALPDAAINAARAETQASLVHQADISLRKSVASRIQSAPGDERKRLAKALGAAKASVLEQLRSGAVPAELDALMSAVTRGEAGMSECVAALDVWFEMEGSKHSMC